MNEWINGWMNNLKYKKKTYTTYHPRVRSLL